MKRAIGFVCLCTHHTETQKNNDTRDDGDQDTMDFPNFPATKEHCADHSWSPWFGDGSGASAWSPVAV